MAVGDVVAGRIAGQGNFVPAAGVEVCITSVTNYGNVDSIWGQASASFDGDYVCNAPAAASGVQSRTIKMFINNTYYLRTFSGGTYSGVQTQ